MRFAIRVLTAGLVVGTTAGVARAELLPPLPTTGEAVGCIAILMGGTILAMLFALVLSYAIVKAEQPPPRRRRRRRPEKNLEKSPHDNT